MFRSTNGGDSWQQINQGLTGSYVLDLSISPAFATDTTLFVAIEDGGIFRSTDRGDTWQQIKPEVDYKVIPALGLSPAFATDNTLFAGTVGGVFRSTDRGHTWEEVNQGLTDTAVSTLEVSPAFATDSTLFVGTPSGDLFRSTNGGDTWEEFNQGMSHHNINALGLSPAFVIDNILFAGTTGAGVFRWEPTPEPCTLSVALGYEGSTLNMDFEVATLEPALWRVWLIVPSIGAIPIVTLPLPAIEIILPLSFPFPNLGTVGFLTTLSTAEGITCIDFGLVDTGFPLSSAPSAQELRELLPHPSAVIPGN